MFRQSSSDQDNEIYEHVRLLRMLRPLYVTDDCEWPKLTSLFRRARNRILVSSHLLPDARRENPSPSSSAYRDSGRCRTKRSRPGLPSCRACVACPAKPGTSHVNACSFVTLVTIVLAVRLFRMPANRVIHDFVTD